MSNRLTSIHLPGSGDSGWAEWGRKTPTEMIKTLREKARRDKDAAEQVLAASDDQFHVVTYVGVHVQRKRETLQESSIFPRTKDPA